MDYEKQLDKRLYLGDSRPACVMSLEPLLVAAYSDDLDCVVMLKYPFFLIEEHELQVGSRLLTINSYFEGRRIASDLIPGPNHHGPWSNFYPMIAEFFSDDAARIVEPKAEITDEEWDRCQALGEFYLEKFPGRFRNGSPLRSAARLSVASLAFPPATAHYPFTWTAEGGIWLIPLARWKDTPSRHPLHGGTERPSP
jgi:hypothetical protein